METYRFIFTARTNFLFVAVWFELLFDAWINQLFSETETNRMKFKEYSRFWLIRSVRRRRHVFQHSKMKTNDFLLLHYFLFSLCSFLCSHMKYTWSMSYRCAEKIIFFDLLKLESNDIVVLRPISYFYFESVDHISLTLTESDDWISLSHFSVILKSTHTRVFGITTDIDRQRKVRFYFDYF